MYKLPEELARWRRARGLSRTELGSEIGVSQQTVSDWEAGNTVPRIVNLIRIVQVLKVSALDVGRALSAEDQDVIERLNRLEGLAAEAETEPPPEQ